MNLHHGRYQGVLKTMEKLDEAAPEYMMRLGIHIYYQAW
jgi:hypothetical protein